MAALIVRWMGRMRVERERIIEAEMDTMRRREAVTGEKRRVVAELRQSPQSYTYISMRSSIAGAQKLSSGPGLGVRTKLTTDMPVMFQGCCGPGNELCGRTAGLQS
jgi:hypothetical protein